MDLIIPIILFAIGLVLLIKGGDWFVDGATGIAHRFHIPEILIGATVVSIGTTLPEVMVSATGAMQGSGAMAYGNAIGSIICNTSLIAALTVAIRPSNVDKKTLRFPVIFFFGAMAVYSFMSYYFGTFYRWSGIVLLACFVAYMTVLVLQARKEMKLEAIKVDKEFVADVIDDQVDEENQSSAGDFLGFLIAGACLIGAQVVTVVGTVSSGEGFNFFEGGVFSGVIGAIGYFLSGILGLILAVIGAFKASKKANFWLLNSNVLFLILGAAVIAIGADLLVDNGTLIAQAVGVPETVIALTFVALGTSLPELVTAITSLLKGHSSLSLGNIIGANIFNLVLVSGTAITISPFNVPAEKTIQGLNASLVVDIPLVFVVMGLLTIPTLLKGKLSRWQGIVLMCIYAGFCAFQFVV